MFDSATVQTRTEISTWTAKRYLPTHKDARRFKYLTIYLINDWISNNDLVLKKLAYVTNENQQQSKDLFYKVYLSTSVLNEALSHSL